MKAVEFNFFISNFSVITRKAGTTVKAEIEQNIIAKNDKIPAFLAIGNLENINEKNPKAVVNAEIVTVFQFSIVLFGDSIVLNVIFLHRISPQCESSNLCLILLLLNLTLYSSSYVLY